MSQSGVVFPAVSAVSTQAAAAAQLSWGYDPQNVTGAASDTGPGTGGDQGTTVAPLATWAEFLRRTLDVVPTNGTNVIYVRFFSVDTVKQRYKFGWRELVTGILYVVFDEAHLTKIVASANIDAFAAEVPSGAACAPRKLTCNALTMATYAGMTATGALSFKDLTTGCVFFSPSGTAHETAHVMRQTAPFPRALPTNGAHWPRPASPVESAVGHAFSIRQLPVIGGFDFSGMWLGSDPPTWSADTYAVGDSYRILIEGFEVCGGGSVSGNSVPAAIERPMSRGPGMVAYYNCIVGSLYLSDAAITSWWGCVIHTANVFGGKHQLYGCLIDWSPEILGGILQIQDCYHDTIGWTIYGGRLETVAHTGGNFGPNAFMDGNDFPSGGIIQNLSNHGEMLIGSPIYGSNNDVGIKCRAGAKVFETKPTGTKAAHQLNNLLTTVHGSDVDGQLSIPNTTATNTLYQVNATTGAGVLELTV